MSTVTPTAATTDATRLDRLLPLVRVHWLRGFLPASTPSDVVALYRDTLVVGRSRTDPAVPESSAGPNGASALMAHLRRKKVLPLAEITRVTVERCSLVTPLCRCVAYSAKKKARWKLPDYEMEHLMEAFRALLGERFILKKWIRLRFPPVVLLFYLFSACLLGLGLLFHMFEWVVVSPLPLLMMTPYQLLDIIPRKLPFEHAAKAKSDDGKDLSGRQPFRSALLGWALTAIAAAVILPTLVLRVWGAPALLCTAVLLGTMPVLYLGYLLRQEKGRRAGKADSRPPVLYLRSFLDDGKSDLQPTSYLAVTLGVAPQWAVRRPWRYLFLAHPIRILRILLGRTVDTSEEQLGIFLRRNGPFIAIGKPGERFATPGALRTYVTNEAWRDTVIELLSQSQFVVLQPAKTEGIWWEIERSVGTVPPQRILVCLVNFQGRQNDYDTFRLRAEEHVPRPLPRFVGCSARPAFLYFGRDWTPYLQPLSYYSPFSWPLRGSAIDLDYTLQTFLRGLDEDVSPMPRPARRHRGHGILAACLYLFILFPLASHPSALLRPLQLVEHAANELRHPQVPGESAKQPAPTASNQTASHSAPAAPGAPQPAPNSPAAFQQRGHAHLARREYDQAIAVFSAWLEREPKNPQPHNDRGFARDAKGDYAGALADYDEAIRLKPDYALAFNNRGYTRTKNGEAARALADYDRAIALAPESPLTYGNRGLLLQTQGQHDKAVADFTAALRNKTGNADVIHFSRGTSHAALGRHDQAIADFTEAVRLEPRYARAFYQRAESYLARKEPDRAVQDFSRVLELEPGAVKVFGERGSAFYIEGKYEAAISDFDRAVKADPSEVNLRKLRGMSHAQLGHWKEADLDFEKAAVLAPGDVAVWSFLAYLRLKTGDLHGYRGTCKAILDRFGKTKNAVEADRAAWACVLVPDAVCDSAGLMSLAERAAVGAPKSYSAAVTRAAALYRAGLFSDAVRRLHEAIALHGKGGSAYDGFLLALAHWRLGQHESGRKELSRAQRWLDEHYGSALAEKKGTPTLTWNVRLELELLRREAETVTTRKP